MVTRQVPHLRLVTGQQQRASTDQAKSASSAAPAAQGSLFPAQNSNTMLFVFTPRLVAATFSQLLKETRPRWILDLRPVPRFDVIGPSRKEVFRLFEALHIQYIDLSGILGVTNHRSASMNASILSDSINRILLPGGQVLEGPVLFLIDNQEYLQHIGELMPRFLSAPGRKGWETVRIAGSN